MQLSEIQLAAFIGWNLILAGTFVAAIWRMWAESRREPRAQWASNLREAIDGRLEAFASKVSTISDIESRLDDLEQQEKRHFASLSKQIRDNIELDEDEVTQTIVHVVHQYMRSMQIQNQRQQPSTPEVAPTRPTADITSTSNGIPGLREGNGPKS